MIQNAVEKFHREGISQETFERARRAVYGRNLSIFNSTEAIGTVMMNLSFADQELFHYIDCIAQATLDQVHERLGCQLDNARSALSVVSPIA